MSLRILVTGAAGFIGSHTCQKLLSRGHSVVGLDNLNDYYSPERKRANLAQVSNSPGAERFSFEKGDLRDRDFLESLIGGQRFDCVVNLGAMAGVRASIDDPHLYFDVNTTGTLNLLVLCQAHKIRNFVLASTSSVYGDTQILPFVETDVCDRPLAPYAASKRAAEMLCYTYYHLFGVESTVLRFFTVYGPRGRPDMMAYKVLDNIFNGSPLQLFNGGEMWRDWTYVDDITDGVCAAVERPVGYEIFNLGRGEMVKLTDFVLLLEELAGKRASTVNVPKLDADIDRSFADTSKARRLLGYDPKTSVRQGVESFWNWYREHVLERSAATD